MSDDSQLFDDLIGLADKVLEVNPKATQQQIRDAYKKYVRKPSSPAPP
jgi:hypothetical protein